MNMVKIMLKIIVNKVIKAIVMMRVRIRMNKMMKVNKMMRVIVKVIMVIKFISVLMGLVSITPGHVKLDWLPPPKVDRVNDNPAHYQH